MDVCSSVTDLSYQLFRIHNQYYFLLSSGSKLEDKKFKSSALGKSSDYSVCREEAHRKTLHILFLSIFA